ncbi:MAG: hypothetical protein ACYTCN_01900, partial [Planctomycetota bacterium]
LEQFWSDIGKSFPAEAVFQAAKSAKTQVRAKIKAALRNIPESLQKQYKFRSPEALKFLLGFKWIFTETDAVILVYQLPNRLIKVIRLCSEKTLDALSGQAACQSFVYGAVRTDIFHDHGQWISPWIENLKAYAKDPSLKSLEEMLLCDNLHKVKTAISQLGQKIRRKENPEQSLRLLYSALYYWNHPDKGFCRSICLEVSAMLEDILTESKPYPPLCFSFEVVIYQSHTGQTPAHPQRQNESAHCVVSQRSPKKNDRDDTGRPYRPGRNSDICCGASRANRLDSLFGAVFHR